MKHFASLFCVFVAIALVGPATGDDTVTTGCTLEVEEGKSINDTMYENVKRCQITYLHMGKNPSDELIRETMIAFCAERPKLQQCLEGLDDDARRCLDYTEQIRHRLYRQYEQLEFDVYCENNWADNVDGFRRQEESSDNDNVQACLANAKTQVGAVDTVSANGFMLHTYAVMHKGIECLDARKGQGDDALLDWMIAVTRKVMNRMKCIKDDAEVLCKTIVDSH